MAEATMATTTTIWDFAISMDVVQLITPLLVANILNWVLLSALTIQIFIVFLRLSQRKPHNNGPAGLVPSATYRDSRFAASNLPAHNGGVHHSAGARSIASFDPYVTAYPPYSPTTPSSARPSDQFSHRPRSSNPASCPSHSPLPQNILPHPRLPHEHAILMGLICIIYAIVCFGTILGTTYTWWHVRPGFSVDSTRIQSTTRVWMRVVASELVGAIIFIISLLIFNYHLYLITPSPLPNSRLRSILKSKPQHVQPLPSSRAQRVSHWCNVSSVILSAFSVVVGLFGIVSGVKHSCDRLPLGTSPRFDVSTSIWLAGSLFVNVVVSLSIALSLPRTQPYIQSGVPMRILRFLAETNLVPAIISVVELGLSASYRHQTKPHTSPLVFSLILPALYANTVLFIVTRSDVYPLISGSYDAGTPLIPVLLGGQSKKKGIFRMGSFGRLAAESKNTGGKIDGSLGSQGVGGRGSNGDSGPKAVSFIVGAPRPPRIISAHSLHMDRDIVGETSSKRSTKAGDDAYEVHVLSDLSKRASGQKPTPSNAREESHDTKMQWFPDDDEDDDEEGDQVFGLQTKKKQVEVNLNEPEIFPRVKSGLSDDSSTPLEDKGTGIPRDRFAEYRMSRHNSTSSSIPQFQTRAADDARSVLSVATNHRKAPPHIYRHDSHASLPQFHVPNRAPSPKRPRMSEGNLQALQEMSGDTVDPSSLPTSSVLDDTSIMIIGANNDPSIVEPSMFKAASVAATRASTGSAWSSYTYPKPMAFPELDEDLRDGHYDPNPEPSYEHVDIEAEGSGIMDSPARSFVDVPGQHPYARAPFEMEVDDARKREEESRKRRWRVHPLKRMVEMGRRW